MPVGLLAGYCMQVKNGLELRKSARGVAKNFPGVRLVFFKSNLR